VSDSRQLPDDDDAPEVTDELVAYLDGELDPKSAADMSARLNRDPNLRAQAEMLKRAWDFLDVLPRPEPSGSFTSRTLSQVLPVPEKTSGGTAVLPAAATITAFPTTRSGPGFWLISAALILLGGGAGYLAQPYFTPAVQVAPLDPPLEDVPLSKNMRLYRQVDNLEYLLKLDSPELFADEGE
jgi:anti-sigma factor RsiW